MAKLDKSFFGKILGQPFIRESFPKIGGFPYLKNHMPLLPNPELIHEVARLSFPMLLDEQPVQLGVEIHEMLEKRLGNVKSARANMECQLDKFSVQDIMRAKVFFAQRNNKYGGPCRINDKPKELPEKREEVPMRTLTIEYLEKEECMMADVFYRKTAVIKDMDTINNGVECVWLPVDVNRGLKLYSYRTDGQRALESQAEAFESNIGPEVLSELMEIIFPMGTDKNAYCLKNFFKKGVAFGYYTVKANTQKASHTRMNDNEQFRKDKKELRTKIDKAKLSFPVSDLHDNNVAYVGDTLVAIDFGWHTTNKMTRSEQERRT